MPLLDRVLKGLTYSAKFPHGKHIDIVAVFLGILSWLSYKPASLAATSSPAQVLQLPCRS